MPKLRRGIYGISTVERVGSELIGVIAPCPERKVLTLGSEPFVRMMGGAAWTAEDLRSLGADLLALAVALEQGVDPAGLFPLVTPGS